MLSDIRQISILNKIFNVRGNEWSKIVISWIIAFFYRVGFVIGWTLIVTLFVSRYGISSLPYLFVMNAVFSILGSLFFSILIDKFKKVSLMIIILFISVLLLFLAFYFASSNLIMFFALLIITEAMFLCQFRIMLHGFTEEMFTPIQSERTFPLIESSETIGGIIGGLAVVFMSKIIDPASFLLIWIAVLLLSVPFIFICEAMNKKIKLATSGAEKEHKSTGFLSKIFKGLSSKTHLSYIKGIFLIIFFQWFLFNLLDFQYTKAVYQNVSHVVLDSGSGFEHAFVHNLGQLFILFSGSALIIQLFVGSRLIGSLGVIGSMMLHPIVNLLSLFGLTLSFNFRNAVLAKNNFTITTVVHTNAYHSSYYAINEDLRENIREVLDGIIRPLGALFGTIVLIILQKLFIGNELIFYVNISMIVITLVLLYVIYNQQNKYTSLALNDLQNSEIKEVRSNAIDILAQKGHKYDISILTDILLDKKEPISIRVKILKAIAEIKEISVIPNIIDCLFSPNAEIRGAFLDTLLSYKNLIKHSKYYIVYEFRLINDLERAYKIEKNDDLRSKILTLLSHISNVSTFEFLMNVLKNAKGDLKADVINALGNYKDIAVTEFIRPYLKAEGHKQRLSAIISLGRFKEYRDEVLGIILTLLHSNNNSDIIDGLFAVGELKLKRLKNICFKFLSSKNDFLRLYSACALAKMQYQESISVFIDLLFSHKEEISFEAKKLLENVDVVISKNIAKIIKHLVLQKVEEYFPDDKEIFLKDLSHKNLKKLRWLYSLVGEYDEIELINNILKT